MPVRNIAESKFNAMMAVRKLLITRTELKQGLLTRLCQSAQPVRHLGGVAIAALLIASCGNAGIPNSTKSIVVDRQVVLAGFRGDATSITRRPDGGFVVTGSLGTAWAVATNSHGEVLWRYREPRDPQAKTPFESKLIGAATLADGRVLLCGENSVHAGIAQLTILDDKGVPVEQRTEIPTDDRHFMSSSIGSCFPWDDGIAVIGGATNGTTSAPWLMKLDRNGVKQWQIFLKESVAANPVETVDHGLVLSSFSVADLEVELVRLNPKGDVEAKRAIKGYGYVQLRSLEQPRTIRVISYGVGNQGTLYTLNDHLEDAEPPMGIGTFDAQRGCGYVLRDHSLALFGRTDSAAIAWIGESGQTNAVDTLDQKYPSFVVSDSVPISATQFVTLRNSVSPNAEDQGLVMSWVTFK